MTEASLFPITLQGVGLRRGANWVLHGLDLQLERGGIIALVGPNGAGKTSLLRLIHGLDAPSCGALRFAGKTPPRDGLAFAAQAMVFAHTPLLRGSVEDNLRLALVATPTDDHRALLNAALDRAGLKEHARHSAASLSSGQRQRLALTRAWMVQPQLLLLDEPCSHLDQRASAAILHDVQNLAAQGITVLLSTHRPEEIALAQRVLRLEPGQLQTSHEPLQPTPRRGGTAPQGDISCSPTYACTSQV